MGIISTPTTYADGCPLCFPPDCTPVEFKCFITGILKSPHFPGVTEPAPNGYCDLIHTGPGCNWAGGSERVWGASLDYVPGHSQLVVQAAFGLDAFVHAPAFNCVTYFTNAHQDPNIFAFYGGWGYISTPMRMDSYISTITPLTGPDPRMELYVIGDGQVVMKFCDKRNATNVKIRMQVPLWWV